MLLSEICGLVSVGAPSLTRGRVYNLQCNHSMVRVAQNLGQSQSHFTAVSQYVLASSQFCARFTNYCFLFKSLGLESVVLSLWGVLSDDRPSLSFVSHSLVEPIYQK
jgi:hypothetical protein